MRISRVHHPVRTLGFGSRVGVWVQGCSIGCHGCVSADTWDPDGAREVPVETVLEYIRSLTPSTVDGVTISGGEPFEQPDELLDLLLGIKQLADERNGGEELDILCYSGFSLARLSREFPTILNQLDALIPGPFVESLPTALIWRGSANQDLVVLSQLGEARYNQYVDHIPTRPPMQVEVDEAGIWWIGIPRRDDMERLRQRMETMGVVIDDPSWNARGSR